MRGSLLLVLVVSGVLLLGCSRLGIQQTSIALDAVFSAPNHTDATVTYSLPPAPEGKTYVLWIVNPQLHQAVRAGTAEPGRNRVAKASVDFEATGAVITVESTPSPTAMGDDWALKVGTVTLDPSTPTPDPLRITPTPKATPTMSSPASTG